MKRGVATIVLGLAVGGGPLGLVFVLRSLTEDAAAQAAPRMERILWGGVAFGALLVVAGIVRLARARSSRVDSVAAREDGVR